jgi:hypothetical protein
MPASNQEPASPDALKHPSVDIPCSPAINWNLTNHTPTPEQLVAIEQLRYHARWFAYGLEQIPHSRERALAPQSCGTNPTDPDTSQHENAHHASTRLAAPRRTVRYRHHQ